MTTINMVYFDFTDSIGGLSMIAYTPGGAKETCVTSGAHLIMDSKKLVS